jgi:nucleotide-binding universal stress UspA family protein
MSIRKILVPVDFSEDSRRALDEAIGLAKVFGAGIHLLHCYPLDLSGAARAYGVTTPESYVEKLHDAAVELLSSWRSKVRAEKIDAEQTVSAHPPVSAIAALADEIGADLIVMGTRGRSGMKHLLLGSVAERTIRTARCPVLTVKSDPPSS